LAKEEWSRPNSSSRDYKCTTISVKPPLTALLRNWLARFLQPMLVLSPVPTNFSGAAKRRCAAGRIKAFQQYRLIQPNSENWRFEWVAKITNPGDTITSKRANAFTPSIKNTSPGKSTDYCKPSSCTSARKTSRLTRMPAATITNKIASTAMTNSQSDRRARFGAEE